MLGYQCVTFGDLVGTKDNISAVVFGCFYNQLPSFKQEYVDRQIATKQRRGFFSAWLTEQLVIGMVD